MSHYSSTSTTEISLPDSITSARQSWGQVSHSYLRPEDAFAAKPLPRRRSNVHGDSIAGNGEADGGPPDARLRREKRGECSSSRRRRSGKEGHGKGQWKKLLWVKQSYPDNYTDEETFLDHLQRNPSLQPYEFWTLVADSTIIVQHVCSVIIFVCCFTAIYQERISPQAIVGWATTGTVAGWVIKDYWQSREEAEMSAKAKEKSGTPLSAGTEEEERGSNGSSSETAEFGMPSREHHVPLATTGSGFLSQAHSRISSMNSVDDGNHSHITSPLSTSARSSTDLPSGSGFSPLTPTTSHTVPWTDDRSSLSPRTQERLTTAKSAILIYCSLLGLSPILKSLTRSTSSDSIWALSAWLLVLNVFTFDYGAGPESKFPASLSTNCALMASTVLASRLPTTTHVFCLTLFSIEVFGLFPVFRRHLRHHSWNGHCWLSTFLVVLASGGLSMTISGGGLAMGVVGLILGGLVCSLSMGMTSWWLIGLQRYKNEIHGPWDPARPVLRPGWD